MTKSTNYLVCYDITEDEIRTQIAGICKDYGLVRIQYSVFYGQLQKSQVKTLVLDLKQGMTEANGDIHILKVCASCEQDHKILTAIHSPTAADVMEQDYEEVSEEEDAYGGVLIL